MAEAYAKSLTINDESVIISSSGIEANVSTYGDVEREAVEALQSENLTKYLAPTWHRTTQTMLDEADALVFMSKTVYADASFHYRVDEKKCQVWGIPDEDGVFFEIKKQVRSVLHAKGLM